MVAAGATVAVLATALGAWATDTGPFADRDSYCWGAWQEDGGFDLVGDAGFEGPDARSRTGSESAPTRQRPRGRCTVELHSSLTYGSGGKSVQDTTVTVAYGPAPKSAKRRVEWVAGYLGDHAMPLPGGLPGAVDETHGLLVLPKRCDTADGRPTAVTLDAREEPGADDPATPDLGGSDAVSDLLVAAAGKGMEAAGCAPAKPLRLTSPLPTLPEEVGDVEQGPACRIPGLDPQEDVDEDTARRLEYQVGAVTRDLQSCSVVVGRSVLRGERYDKGFFDALMIREPRLTALLHGVTGDRAPAPGWRGTGSLGPDQYIVRAECAKRPTTFLMLGPSAGEDYFTAFTGAVTRRLGCAPVAPAPTGGTH
ncbi:hypothetical protein AB0N81_17745 [Streptomyces sp. NPDC093510]|uniref:hypothetical protein n=1 Tax=Streptomyces sp. NPDC093510 TaxID=3155199 RepID=UPI00341341F9